MSEVFDAVESDYNEPQDAEHFETVFQGVIDTVDGMETLSSNHTKAQQYLFGCMDAADIITYQQRIDGMEGVFSAIGDGLSAAWEYIKKLFKTVWGFFFGSGENTVDAKAEKTKEKITENKEALQQLTKTGKSDKQVETIRTKVKNRAKKIQDNPRSSSSDKAEAKSIIEEIDKGNVKPASGKEVDANKLSERLGKIDKESREFLIKRVGETENLRRKFIQYAQQDRSADIGEGRFKAMYKDFHDIIKRAGFGNPIPELVKVDSIKTIMDASVAQDKLIKEVDGHAEFVALIKKEKGDFEHDIAELQKVLAQKGKGSNSGDALGETFKNKGELKKRLASAKAALSIVNATAGFQISMFNSLERLSCSLVDVYGDYSGPVRI